MEFYHTPIMLKEIINYLNIKPNGVYVDFTIGGAGHSYEIVKKLGKNGLLIGFDKDLDAINYSSKRLSEICDVYLFDENLELSESERPKVILVKSDFKNFEEYLDKLKIEKIDGALMDLGMSSHQIDTADRGFSFRLNGNLDMRMDTSSGLTASELVNTCTKEQLIEIFRRFGEEEFASKIADNIVKYREISPIRTTKTLNDLVESSIPKKVAFARGGASKKVFQAIRIVINSELENLDNTLMAVVKKLSSGGRFCVLSFHSLEDRIVKQTFKLLNTDCICPKSLPVCVCGHKAEVKLVNKKPEMASEQEKKANSRSASAKLRVVEKI